MKTKDELRIKVRQILVDYHRRDDYDLRKAEDDMLHLLALPLDVPGDEEIWKWWKEQKFQRVRGEQEYIMIYEIDLPKILKSFTEHFLTGCETK